ncbi:MBOAT family protein [Porphyromonas levii]|nr:Peptidoglycan O-acetyltransferase [Porphyromonas levii]MBR8762936.1 Peptidoglycan O-acetyltransferase [Porphyromonas levii]TFH97019.1 MBOAT family protein [Porphyromonas levii]
MLFNSIQFLLFFFVVCIVYYILQGNKARNLFLLVASYYFYMNWEPIYAVLILLSTIITYVCGLLVEKSNDKHRTIYLVVSLLLNLGILFIFKYYDFINSSVTFLLSQWGLKWDVPNLHLLLPVGISFYTFQAIGYSIDVYRGTIPAERNFFTYALFVSFFPQLVAGPIERAKNLLPQFHTEHSLKYNNVSEGVKQMIWGFFMKLCIADIISEYVDAVYNNIVNHGGLSIILATLFFTIQIYCDFSGYSNIAIGAARVMGFKLMDNFRQPYLSHSLKEFWKRWHISLSTWFMDYVYIPLGGNRVKYSRHLLNLFITFLVSGIWHGANWTFLIWGAIHGIFISIENVWNRFIKLPPPQQQSIKPINTITSFIIVAFAWLFFRANNLYDAIIAIQKMFTAPGELYVDNSIFLFGFMGISVLAFKDIKDRYNMDIKLLHSQNPVIKYGSFVLLFSYILLFGAFYGGQFIYFQF